MILLVISAVTIFHVSNGSIHIFETGIKATVPLPLQTYYSTSTIVNTTTMTIIETTAPRAPIFVMYNVELFFEEDDLIQIETSSGARVYINPNLEEIERRDWIRFYTVTESGNYKIRVTTGHGSDRLYVNIYRISTKQYYLTSTLVHSTTINKTENMTSTFQTTTNLTKTHTSMPVTSVSKSTDTIEAIPGYTLPTIAYGIFGGGLFLLLMRKRSTRIITALTIFKSGINKVK